MLQFDLNAANGFSVILQSGGTPVTGLTEADVTLHYSIDGSAPTQYSLSASEFTEPGSDIEGVYFIEVAASVFSTKGEIIFDVSSSQADRYLVRGQIGATSAQEDIQTRTQTILQDVREVQGTGFTEGSDSLEAQSSRFETRIPSEAALLRHIADGSGTADAPTDTGLWDVLGDGSETLPGIGSRLDRVVGLSQENYRIFDQTYDTSDNLTGATIKLYDTKSDTINDTDPIAEYKLEASYDPNGRLEDYKMYRES